MSDIVERLRVVSPDDYAECCSVMEEARAEIAKLRESYGIAWARMKGAEGMLDAARRDAVAERRRVDEEIEGLRRDVVIAQLVAEAGELKRDVEHKCSEIDRMREIIDRRDERIDAMKVEIRGYRAELKGLRRELEDRPRPVSLGSVPGRSAS